MKQKIAVTMTALALVASVQADYYVQTIAGFGFSSNIENADPTGATPALGAGESALVQLIYVGANGAEYAGINPGNSFGGIDYVLGGIGALYGDDVQIGSFQTTPAVGGDFFTEFAVFDQVTRAPYVGAEVVARVFIDGGYFEKSFSGNDLNPDGSPPASPEAFYVDNGSLDGSSITLLGVQPNGDNFTVIPEPATFGLLGVAGLGLFLARKKARS